MSGDPVVQALFYHFGKFDRDRGYYLDKTSKKIDSLHEQRSLAKTLVKTFDQKLKEFESNPNLSYVDLSSIKQDLDAFNNLLEKSDHSIVDLPSYSTDSKPSASQLFSIYTNLQNETKKDSSERLYPIRVALFFRFLKELFEKEPKEYKKFIQLCTEHLYGNASPQAFYAAHENRGNSFSLFPSHLQALEKKVKERADSPLSPEEKHTLANTLYQFYLGNANAADYTALASILKEIKREDRQTIGKLAKEGFEAHQILKKAIELGPDNNVFQNFFALENGQEGDCLASVSCANDLKKSDHDLYERAAHALEKQPPILNQGDLP